MSAYTLLVAFPLTAALVVLFSRIAARRIRQAFLLAANMAFLFVLLRFSFRHAVSLLILLLANFAAIQLILRRYRPAATAFALIAVDAALLALFYAPADWPFFLASAKAVLNPFALAGISFLILRLIHILVDAAEGALSEIDILDYFNYLLFFPTYLAGPLERYQRFAEDAAAARRPSYKDGYEAVERIVRGMFKKAVLAPCLRVFSFEQIAQRDIEQLAAWHLPLALYAYGGTLYLTFSGINDIGIGLAALLGFDLPENFAKPLRARNIQDFWNRWHMTFTGWLKDYVFYPIGRVLMRRLPENPAAALALSALLTFLIGGLWHGAERHFLAYGAFHGLGFLGFKAYDGFLKRRLSAGRLRAYEQSRWIGLAANFVTFNYLAVGWLLFAGRLPSWRMILEWLR